MLETLEVIITVISIGVFTIMWATNITIIGSLIVIILTAFKAHKKGLAISSIIMFIGYIFILIADWKNVHYGGLAFVIGLFIYLPFLAYVFIKLFRVKKWGFTLRR